MPKYLHYGFRPIPPAEPEAQRYIHVDFWSHDLNGNVRMVGQSQMVKEQQWPLYRSMLERGGWSHKELGTEWYEMRRPADVSRPVLSRIANKVRVL